MKPVYHHNEHPHLLFVTLLRFLSFERRAAVAVDVVLTMGAVGIAVSEVAVVAEIVVLIAVVVGYFWLVAETGCEIVVGTAVAVTAVSVVEQQAVVAVGTVSVVDHFVDDVVVVVVVVVVAVAVVVAVVAVVVFSVAGAVAWV